jgi:CheY-like chemotaxis protein
MECLFKCVIIEDDQESVLSLKNIVERFGFIAFSANSAASTLEIMKKEKIDLVFMDTRMAGLDGIELIGKIRNSGDGYADVPIVAVTSCSKKKDREKCLETGLNDCVVKPYGAYEVAEVIGRFCHLPKTL